MTLDEFLNRGEYLPNSAYVKEPGFTELYVRDTSRYINGVKTNTLDIARVVVRNRGKGTFTALVNRIKGKYNIYVECVTTLRFEGLLARLEFIKIGNSEGFPSYYMEKQPCPKIG